MQSIEIFRTIKSIFLRTELVHISMGLLLKCKQIPLIYLYQCLNLSFLSARPRLHTWCFDNNKLLQRIKTIAQNDGTSILVVPVSFEEEKTYARVQNWGLTIHKAYSYSVLKLSYVKVISERVPSNGYIINHTWSECKYIFVILSFNAFPVSLHNGLKM